MIKWDLSWLSWWLVTRLEPSICSNYGLLHVHHIDLCFGETNIRKCRLKMSSWNVNHFAHASVGEVVLWITLLKWISKKLNMQRAHYTLPGQTHGISIHNYPYCGWSHKPDKTTFTFCGQATYTILTISIQFHCNTYYLQFNLNEGTSRYSYWIKR